MISIIVCSRSKNTDTNYLNNITETIGVEFELIHVDNSANTYSIFSAYNFGYRQSKYKYICFVHEDVRFHSANWGQRLIEHLSNSETGIVGVAGADSVNRIPMAWSKVFSPGEYMLQRDKKGIKEPELLVKPAGYAENKRTTVTLDGVMLCMRRELLEKGIQFDEAMKGFHGYDYDISIQSCLAGYQNYVVYDILLEHFSGGKTNQDYFRNLIYIYKKNEKYLPITGKTMSEELQKRMPALERKNLNQLTKKMTRKGFSINEITEQINYFSHRINNPEAMYLLPLRIFLIRLFNCPKYLFGSK